MHFVFTQQMTLESKFSEEKKKRKNYAEIVHQSVHKNIMFYKHLSMYDFYINFHLSCARAQPHTAGLNRHFSPIRAMKVEIQWLH